MGNFFYLNRIKNKWKFLLATFIASMFCLFMLFYPDMSLTSAQKGVSIWVNNILPTMFPFFVCANFMNNIGITSYLKPGNFAFSMSILSGYPMGAKILGDMCRREIIGKGECKRLIGFCTTSGPAFMLGTIGTSMLGNHVCGLIILLSHYVGAIVNGIFLNCFLRDKQIKKNDVNVRLQKASQGCNYGDLLECLTNAIYAAFKSLGVILAYVVMFMILTDALQVFGAFNNIKNPFYVGFLKGIFEMTVGCAAISGNVNISILSQVVGCCALVSFGGLSIIGQSLSMLSNTGITFRYLLIVKSCHAIFSSFIAYSLMLTIY